MALFVDGVRPTKKDELRLKLLLSTYTDGSGENEGGSLPGGFDFERAAAEWMRGVHIPGTKHIYDVVLHEGGKIYGFSCKMRSTLKEAYRKEALSAAAAETAEEDEDDDSAPVPDDASDLTGYCLIEVSNAGAKFLSTATKMGITKDNITDDSPERREALREIGEAIVAEIESWHHDAQPAGAKPSPARRRKGEQALLEAAAEQGPTYEPGSLMLHLAWSKPRKAKVTKTKNEPAVPAQYQLFVFDRHIATRAELDEITWKGRMKVRGEKQTATLYGTRPTRDGTGEELAIEIYLFSGGHVKWYPRAQDAIWVSDRFSLIEAPRQENGLSAKALALFPEEWAEATGLDEDIVEAVVETL